MFGVGAALVQFPEQWVFGLSHGFQVPLSLIRSGGMQRFFDGFEVTFSGSK